MEEIKTLILKAADNRELLKEDKYTAAVKEVLSMLDNGKIRVANKLNDAWVVNDWVQQAILLYFAIAEMNVHEVGPFTYFDKIPLKSNFKDLGVRVVPPATARYGCFIERGAVLMPSYVNLGSYVGAGTMVDTWATVGSCAQIGNSVHLSGGVGIGGVLEPPGARPVIIEDGAFIGSRAIVVEGMLVEEEAVIAANVCLTSSTPIIDVSGSESVEYRGRVPARSVVVPGTRPKKFPSGEFNVSCALIIGKRKESTDKKTSLNETLREFALSV
ncbi:MAG: 2,3,4,5-tetrahydropyridine-2,6-dicarboxylate N-succinyltransferase [Bdellovibrionales bacterium]|nr:2,3,4,5-tetrahydropyridine-2,6-dicarboxylate N-succinyltransferase [Bdellovibrionales bacterium]